jgi:molybdenum cofactor biosynthesis protein B
MSDSSRHHKEVARGQRAACAVLSVSDSRTRESDRGGAFLVEALSDAGHHVSAYELVKDEPGQVEERLRAWIEGGEIDLILTTGGTGISRRDGTVEVTEGLLDKVLPGFGELFRFLSYEEIGAAAMLSRAVAGLAGETLIFTLPGSPAALRLALEKLILPELEHLLWERRR